MYQKEGTVSHQMEMQSVTPETVTQILRGDQLRQIPGTSRAWTSFSFLRRKPPFKYGCHRKAVTSQLLVPLPVSIRPTDRYILWAIETLAMFLKQL